MSDVFFISDLHLGHRNILNFAKEYRHGSAIKEHDDWLISQWNSAVTSKHSLVYVLGDVAFDKEAMQRCLPLMKGRKILVRGNHDNFDTELYLEYFEQVLGFIKYKEFWLSHAPIHPTELRGKKNIHGHVHQNTIQDVNYINVCVEPLKGIPISLLQLRNNQGETNESS